MKANEIVEHGVEWLSGDRLLAGAGPCLPGLGAPRRYRLGRGILNLARGYAKYVLGLLIGSRGRFGNLPAISAF